MTQPPRLHNDFEAFAREQAGAFPLTVGGKRTFIIERVVAGVEIRRASGTSDPEKFLEITKMLDDFEKEARADLAQMIASGEKLATVMLYEVRAGGLGVMFTPGINIPALPALLDWLEKMREKQIKAEAKMARLTAQGKRVRYKRVGYAATTYKVNKVHVEAFLDKKRGRLGMLVKALPHLLTKDIAEGNMPDATQHNLKACLQAFVRDTVVGGRNSALWRELAAIKTEKGQFIDEDDEPGNPQTPANVVRIRDYLRGCGRGRAKGWYGEMWMTGCYTGMGSKEYFVDGFDVEPDHIYIKGRKNMLRKRSVMRLVNPVKPVCKYPSFARYLALAAEALGLKPVTPYDMRRTFVRTLEEAGVPYSRIKRYIGHSAKGKVGQREAAEEAQGQVALYSRHRSDPAYWAKDAALFNAYLKANGGVVLVEAP